MLLMTSIQKQAFQKILLDILNVGVGGFTNRKYDKLLQGLKDLFVVM